MSPRRIEDWHEREAHLKAARQDPSVHTPALTIVIAEGSGSKMFRYRCTLCAEVIGDQFIKHEIIRKTYGSVESAMSIAIDDIALRVPIFARCRKMSKAARKRQQERERWGSYESFLASDEWRRLSERVKERDNHECTQCGSHQHLQSHHLTYDYGWECDPEHLVTLCNQCHREAHGMKGRP